MKQILISDKDQADPVSLSDTNQIQSLSDTDQADPDL